MYYAYYGIFSEAQRHVSTEGTTDPPQPLGSSIGWSHVDGLNTHFPYYVVLADRWYKCMESVDCCQAPVSPFLRCVCCPQLGLWYSLGGPLMNQGLRLHRFLVLLDGMEGVEWLVILLWDFQIEGAVSHRKEVDILLSGRSWALRASHQKECDHENDD